MRIFKLLALAFALVAFLFVPNKAQAGLDVSLNFDFFSPPPPVAVAPPPLPVYVIPPPVADGYVWSPGHWRWNGYGYFWVPGTWVQPPVVGVLWTPGYWGWSSGAFAWHEGYWAKHVGFYGGINYGGGYGGSGFAGGGWNGGHYVVNRSVTNVTNITNVTNVTNNNTTTNNVTNASFNGGAGGTTVTPTPQEQAVASEKHMPPTGEQVAHAQAAARNPALQASANHGKPQIAATAKAGDFTHNISATKQAGPKNVAAEQHNAEIRQNPELAKGAIMPREHPALAKTPHGEPHMQAPPQHAEHPEKHEEPHREPDQHKEGEHPPGQ